MKKLANCLCVIPSMIFFQMMYNHGIYTEIKPQKRRDRVLTIGDWFIGPSSMACERFCFTSVCDLQVQVRLYTAFALPAVKISLKCQTREVV